MLLAVLFGRHVYCSRRHPHYTKAARHRCDELLADYEQQRRARAPGQAPPIPLRIREI